MSACFVIILPSGEQAFMLCRGQMLVMLIKRIIAGMAEVVLVIWMLI